jgi:hypothetical protein
MSTKVGRAILEITTDHVGYERGIGKVGHLAQDLGKEFASLGKRVSDVGADLTKWVTGPMVAVGAGVGALVVGMSESGNAIAKNAREAGLSADVYQELKFAIGQVGQLTEEQTDAAFRKLTLSIGQAAAGSTTASQALKQLGYSQSEIQAGSLTTEGVFERLNTSLQGMSSQAEAATLAGKLLGDEAGPKLAAALRASGGDVANLRQHFKDLGLGMSGEMLANSEKLGDQMDVVGKQFSAMGGELAGQLLPIFTEELMPMLRDDLMPLFRGLVTRLGEGVQWFRGLSTEVKSVIGVAAGLAAAVGPVLVAVGPLLSTMAALAPAITGVGSAMAALALNPVGATIIGIAAAFTAVKLAADASTASVRKHLQAMDDHRTVTEAFNSTTKLSDAELKDVKAALDRTHAATYVGAKGVGTLDKAFSDLNVTLQTAEEAAVGRSLAEVLAADAAADATRKYRDEVRGLADELRGVTVGAEIQKYTDALKLAESQGGLTTTQTIQLAKRLEDLGIKAGGLPPVLQAIADRASFVARTFKDTHDSIQDVIGAVKSKAMFDPFEGRAPGQWSFSAPGVDFDDAVRQSEIAFARTITLADEWGTKAGFSWTEGFGAGINDNPIYEWDVAVGDYLRDQAERDAQEAGTSFSKAFGDGLENLPNVIVGAIQGDGSVIEASTASLGASIGGWLTEHIKRNMGEGLKSSLLSGLAGTAVTVGAQLLGKVFSGNDTKKDREQAATMLGFSSLDALYRELRTLGDEGAALAHEALNVIGKKDKDANNEWIASVEALIAKHKELADVVETGIPSGASGFPTRAQLEESAKSAGEAYAYMRDSGLYTAETLEEAWKKWQDALVESGDVGATSLQKLKGEFESLVSEHDKVFNSIREELENPEYDEAGNRVYGVIEAQGIARLAELDAQKAALQQQMEDAGSKQLSVAATVREGMEKLFGDPLKVPIQFETPWGTWDSGDGLLAGLSRTLTGAGSDRPIDLRVNLDGRQIARNQTSHFGEALEQAGYA